MAQDQEAPTLHVKGSVHLGISAHQVAQTPSSYLAEIQACIVLLVAQDLYTCLLVTIRLGLILSMMRNINLETILMYPLAVLRLHVNQAIFVLLMVRYCKNAVDMLI